jgi:hypothetical protein
MEKKHLSDEQIRSAFASFSEDLCAEDSQRQMASTGMMLNLMSDYLHQNIEGLDTTAILKLIEELNNISNGNEPQFIKSKVLGGGRPLNAGKNTQQAALCAAIEILIKKNPNVKEALNTVSEWSGWSHKKLTTLRADFKKGNKSRDATNYMLKLVQMQEEQNLVPNVQAKVLVEIALKIGE